MTNEQLVAMANQIGDFFKSYPDQLHAQEDIDGHLNKFWAKAMRKQIASYVNEHAGLGLDANVAAAIQAHLHT